MTAMESRNKWMRHVAGFGEKRNLWKILIAKCEEFKNKHSIFWPAERLLASKEIFCSLLVALSSILCVGDEEISRSYSENVWNETHVRSSHESEHFELSQ